MSSNMCKKHIQRCFALISCISFQFSDMLLPMSNLRLPFPAPDGRRFVMGSTTCCVRGSMLITNVQKHVKTKQHMPTSACPKPLLQQHVRRNCNIPCGFLTCSSQCPTFVEPTTPPEKQLGHGAQFFSQKSLDLGFQTVGCTSRWENNTRMAVPKSGKTTPEERQRRR